MTETIGDRIKIKRLANSMTLEELGSKIGVSKVTIYKYENNDITNIPSDKIELLADALRVTPSYLMGWENVFRFENVFPVKTKKIPLLGEIACGKPIYASEDRESYIEVGTDIKADFCLKAKGDSMIGARINDGDIVFIRKQPSVDDGEIAAVLIDDEVTLKRVYYHKDKNFLELRAENPKFQAMIFMDNELDQIVILGKAIAFQSDVI